MDQLFMFFPLPPGLCMSQWAAFAVVRIWLHATIHRPSTNFSILNLSPAEVPALIWSVLIFSCCYFYSIGNQNTWYSDFFALKIGKVGRQGREERTCTCLFHPFLMGQDTMSVVEIISYFSLTLISSSLCSGNLIPEYVSVLEGLGHC